MGIDPTRVREVFLAALDVEDQAAYVDEACGDDVELRERVEELLQSHAVASDFLTPPSTSQESREVAEGPGTTIDRYKLLELIGEGRFGDIYLAEQTEPVRREVALKIIKPGMDTRQVIARFEAERQALALMDHPGIAKVYDAGATVTGRPYFVMELVHGLSITEYCDANKLTVQERLRMFIDVCRAVEHAHQKGIIHRDIKPTNILVTQQDDQPVPKIIDFGVAKATQQRLTEKTLFTEYGQLIGTPEYMSPEQATFGDTDVDTRSDLYSLGVVLYELIVGTTPFNAEALRNRGYDEICRVIRESEPPTPSRQLSGLGDGVADVCHRRRAHPVALHKLLRGDLDWVAMKCLEKDRSRRYTTAGSLATDLTRFLNHEPVDACPPSVGYQLRKFVRRNTLVVVFTTVIILTLLIGIAGTTIGMIRATRAESAARRDAQGEAQARALADRERRRAAKHLARIQLERGVRVLNEGDGRGLLSLLDARQTSHDIPEIHDAAGGLWAIGHDLLASRLEQVLSGGIYSDLSPNGRLLVTVNGPTSQLWDVDSGEPRGPPLDMESAVNAVSFSPDSTLLVTRCSGGVSQLWNAETGEGVGPGLRHKNAGGRRTDTQVRPWSVAFSPSGSLLATGAGDRALRLWDVASGELLAAFEYPRTVLVVAFSADGELLAGASTGGTWRLWNVATRKPLGSPVVDNGGIGKLLFSPDRKLLATFEMDGTAGLWHTDSGKLHKRLEDRRWMQDMAFSPDGKLLATASVDWTVRLWNTSTGEPYVKPLRHGGRVTSVAFSPNGKLIASCALDQTARLWETATGDPVGQALSNPGRLARVEFGSDGSRLVVTGWNGSQIWRLGRRPLEPAPLENNAARLGVVSPDGKSRAVITEDKEAVEFQDAITGGASGVRIVDDFVLAIAWSPDAKLLATGSAGWNAKLWDASSGSLRRDIPCEERVYGVAFSPDGKLLATAQLDGAVNLWDIATGLRHGSPLQHEAPVREVAFSRDGKLLATTSGDEGPSRLHIWSVATDPPYLGLMLPFQPASDRPALSAFNKTGTLYVAGENQQDVHVWRLPQIPTELEEFRLRTAVAIGVEHDLEGRAVAIPHDRWRTLRNSLNALTQQLSTGS